MNEVQSNLILQLPEECLRRAAVINPQGELEFEFPGTDNAAFFQIQTE